MAYSNSQGRTATKNRPIAGGVSKAALKDVPNSKLYVELRELDLRIEQFSNRKKAEICDLNEPLDLKTRCLRLQMFNRHANQESTDPSRPPSWSFFISGHFVDHNQGTVTTAPAPASTPLMTAAIEAERKARVPADRFWTSAMEWVQLRIEQPGQPVDIVRWERNRHVGQHKEMMEVHRLGCEPAKVYITMGRYFAPDFFRVEEPLAGLLATPSGSRGQILRAFQACVAANATPDTADPRKLTPGPALHGILGTATLDASSINGHIDKYLKPLKTVSLEHAIQLDGASPTQPQCCDVEVAWGLKPNMLQLPPFLERLDVRAALQVQDKRITETLSAFKLAQRKRAFLLGFASCPDDFVRKLAAASARDVRTQVSVGAASTPDLTTAVELSAAENFKRAWAQEAAIHYLDRVVQTAKAPATAAPVAAPP